MLRTPPDARADQQPHAVESGFQTIPSTGERFRFLACEEDLVRVDWRLAPDGQSPMHVHPRQTERVTAVRGALAIRFKGGAEHIVVRGQSLCVPPGQVHDFRNAGSESAHMLVDFIPALGMRAFFESVAGLAHDGKTDDAGRPRNPFLLGVFAYQYRDVFAVDSPPRWLQRIALPLLAGIGRLGGLRAHRDDYRQPVISDVDRLGDLVRAASPLEQR